MKPAIGLLVCVFVVSGIGYGCGARRPSGIDGDGGADVDAGPDADTDAQGDGTDGSVYDLVADTGCEIPGSGNLCTDPAPDGCGPVELCNDQVDNDCDGSVDEGCACLPGEVQPCFVGPPGHRGIGGCADGTQRCVGAGEFGDWGPCTGGIAPGGEVCDNLDNDCNGCVDDPLCCRPEIDCPGPGDPRVPDGAPFNDYALRGGDFYTGVATSWRWEVSGGPCDDLYESLVPPQPPSFTLANASSQDATLHPTLSGDYTVTLTVTTPAGETLSCTWIVHVTAPGMRVELCWDQIADIDLHLHRPATTSRWFSATGTIGDINADDCYYYNCKATVYAPPPELNWGYPDSPVSECSGGPEGAMWLARGACRNPRLDIDNVSAGYFPENTNVDNPNEGDVFRVMVHYYGGFRLTYPLVNIYCGGSLVATYGAAPDLVAGFTNGGGWNQGTMWRVVDVTTHTPAGLPVACDVTALHPPASVSGYWVTVGESSY